MTKQELGSFYEKRAIQFNTSLQALKKKINLISNVRLVTAIAILVLLYFGLTNHLLLYLTPLLILLFIVLIRKHSEMFDRKVHLENLISIQQNELQGLEGNFSSFENGSEFIDTHHPYTHDLDIFGDGSLFQFLNRSSTYGGRKFLAERLSAPLTSELLITSHQQAVKELGNKSEFRHEIQASGMEVEESPGDRDQLREWIRRDSFLYGRRFYKIVLTAFPALTLLLLVGSFLIDGLSPFFWLCAILQWAFLGFHIKKVNAFHYYISRKKSILEKYARILKSIQLQNFESVLMQDIGRKAKDAAKKMSALASLVGALDARLNWLTTLVVNSLLLYDLQCIYRLEAWKSKNASSLEGWIDVIHETEMFCSLGTFAFNNENFSFPAVNSELRLKATSMGHPLIDENERVVNDIHLDQQKSILIITGANMAGKSTFLRTLGVNVVLALSGAPVTAAEFDCPLIEIRSGMRTADSLRDHQSYFYAELHRLKSIVDEMKQGRHLLILLDEILKGTNSTDKQAGSIALVKQLVLYPSLVLVATHDLALGNLENDYPDRVRNFCFEPFIENDQLSFDYKLKPGLAQKMNATFLMKKMGIIV